MLNFQAFHYKQITYAELVVGLTKDDLPALTDEMIDTTLALIAECTDADVTFVPADPRPTTPTPQRRRRQTCPGRWGT